jgi:hypothetical protein
MRFRLDSAFRLKVSALAKTAEGLGLQIDEISAGRFLVSDGKRIFHVTAAIDPAANEIDVSCECETFENSRQPCVHIALVLKQRYNPETNSFDLPSVVELLGAVIPEFAGAEEKVAEVREVESRVQKLIEVDEEKIAELADEFDVRQIVISLAGEYEDLPMIYEFRDSRGQTRTVVSWNGYIKAARLQGNIRVEFLGFERVGDRIIAKAKAVDLKRNIEIPAVASRLPRSTEFVHEILASKAIRNALKKVIDPDILAKVIEHAKRMKSVKEVQLKEVASP